MFKSARAPVRFDFDVAQTPALTASSPSAAQGGPADAQAGIAEKPDARPGHSPWRESGQKVVRLLYKAGDDLRQDQFVCQVRCQSHTHVHACLTLVLLALVTSHHGRP